MNTNLSEVLHDPEMEAQVLHAVVQDLPQPPGLPIAGQVLFAGLRLIYKSFCRGNISSADASAERNKLVADCRSFAFRDNLATTWAKKVQDTEAARQAYRKERTLENADRLLAAFEGNVKTKKE